jgi:hypothetical protein
MRDVTILNMRDSSRLRKTRACGSVAWIQANRYGQSIVDQQRVRMYEGSVITDVVMNTDKPRDVDRSASLTALVKRVFDGPVLTAGVFGSQEEDIDILAIMEKMSWAFFDTACARLRDAYPLAAIYPTHRLEEFVSSKKQSSERQKVHLLCYPSLEVFNSVERPFIRYCIAHSYQPSVGSAAVLLQDNNTRPSPDMNFYCNLLWETAQLYSMQSAPGDVLQREIRRKLLYTIKFSLVEAFYDPSGPIALKKLAQTLFERPVNRFCELGGNLYREVMAWEQLDPAVVGAMFDRVYSLLRDLQRHVGCS